MSLEDIITPCTYPSARRFFWLPPEYSNDSHFTVEMDHISFMVKSVDDLWYKVKQRNKFEIQQTPASGKPLESVYQSAQYRVTSCLYPSINIKSLSQCEVFKKIEKDPDSLSHKQILRTVELLTPLGNSGLKEVIKLFRKKISDKNRLFTKERFREIFVNTDFRKRLLACSTLRACFACDCDCGVQNPYELQEKANGDAHLLSKYRLLDDGLYYSESNFKDDNDAIKICSRFRILAKVSDFESKSWGKQVEICAPDGTVHILEIPMKDSAGTSDSIISRLLDYGLEIRPGMKRKVIEYFNLCEPGIKIKQTDKLGWHGDTYVFPKQCIGFHDDDITYTGKPDKFQEKGTLEEWQDNVGKYCEGNSLLMLLVAFALSGPLLRTFNHIEGGGIHLFGPSSIGKTTLAHVSGSVCGGIDNKGYINQWRTTDNALELVAARHNDSLLILDEIGQATSDTVSQVSYMLANGQGKERMRTNASSRKAYDWKINCLSTGELPLSEKIAETGKHKSMAGQEVRMLDLPVLAAGKYGIFEDLHGCNSGNEFSHLLKSNALSYFGSPLRAFVKALCGANKDEIDRNIAEIKASKTSFFKENCPDKCSEQVQRVLDRFALIAAVGEFASRHGIVPWDEASARECLAKWFKIWLEERGTLGSKEIENAITNIIEHWNRNWETLYIDLDDSENRRFNREVSGYYWNDKSSGETVVLMKTEIFNDLTRRANRKELMAELKERGLLACNENSNTLETRWIPWEKRNVRGVGLLPSKWEGKITDEDKAEDIGGKWSASVKLLDPNDPEPEDCF